MTEQLRTFQLVKQDRVISPILTTIREYGRWFEKTFDEYTAAAELYMKSKKGNDIVLESHPGTKIGKFFDSNELHDDKLHSWFILQDSTMMKRLVKYQLAEQRDAIPISVNDIEHRNMIRVYTVEQIQFYIRSNIDKKFEIAPFIGISKQVAVKESDMQKLIIPKRENHRKTLF